jgi:hypothetical protein
LSQQRLPARTLVAQLERAGSPVQLVDLNQGAAQIVPFAQGVQPGLVVGSILFAERVQEYLALMTDLRDAVADAHLTLAGPLPGLAYAELLAACPALNSIIVGEAEAVIASLAAHAQDDWQSLDGIASRINPSLTPAAVLHLDALPFPSHADGIPTRLGYGFATVKSSSGCFHHCALCLPRAFDDHYHIPYRMRPIPHLVDEIEALYSKGTRLFLFDDEQFLAPKRVWGERVAALGDELERRNLRIAFTIKCRADDVQVDLMSRLQDLGLVRVYAGIESGCQATLDRLHKGTTVEQNLEALQTLQALRLVVDFHTLAFHPWADLETLEAEGIFMQRALPYMPTLFDWCQVEIYAGTPLAEQLRVQGRGEGNAWQPSYALVDPRVELLRRLSRLLFQPASKHGRMRDWLTCAWFDQLLMQRFEPSASDKSCAQDLRDLAARVNAASLQVWGEMLSFVRTGNIYDADGVNAHAGEWAAHIDLACYPTSGNCVGT